MAYNEKPVFQDSVNQHHKVKNAIGDVTWMAKEMEPREMLNHVVEKERAEKRTPAKRNIKNKPRNLKGKVYAAVAVVTLSAGIATPMAVKDYKADVAQDSLNTLKEAISATQIMDHSSVTGSNTSHIQQEVVVDGEILTYEAYFNDGQANVITDDFYNEELNSAISTVATAQDGNVFEAMKAKKLADGIKHGEINVSIEKSADKTQSTPNMSMDEGR